MARLGLGHEWSCAWANDNDPRKILIYKYNFGDEHLDSRDIAEVARDIVEFVQAGRAGDPSSGEVPPFPLDVDLAWASFPCQDLSLAGWRRGMSARRSGTYWSFWSIMDALMRVGHRPPIIVIENVVGLLHGDDFRGLCESLAALDMNYGVLLMDARYFLPQSRPRVFVVAVDAALDVAHLAAASTTPKAPSLWCTKGVIQAQASLPCDLRSRWRWWRLPGPPLRRVPIENVFEEDPEGVPSHSAEEIERLLELMTERNRRKIEMARKMPGLQIGFLYKRTRDGRVRPEVRFDGLAGCLRTPRGGSSRQTVVVIKDGRISMRLLSPLEAARLMGAEEIRFPPDFSYNDAYFAMGDGVAVPVVRHLSRHLLIPLARLARKDRLLWKGSLASRATENAYRKRAQERVKAWSSTTS
jgi:DNA (cytosine-5)-methyltransferase 1